MDEKKGERRVKEGKKEKEERIYNYIYILYLYIYFSISSLLPLTSLFHHFCLFVYTMGGGERTRTGKGYRCKARA